MQTAAVQEGVLGKGVLPRTSIQHPHHVKQPPIARGEVLVVSKKSRLERECEARNLTQDELLAQYRDAGESGLRVYASHLRQQ